MQNAHWCAFSLSHDAQWNSTNKNCQIKEVPIPTAINVPKHTAVSVDCKTIFKPHFLSLTLSHLVLGCGSAKKHGLTCKFLFSLVLLVRKPKHVYFYIKQFDPPIDWTNCWYTQWSSGVPFSQFDACKMLNIAIPCHFTRNLKTWKGN